LIFSKKEAFAFRRMVILSPRILVDRFPAAFFEQKRTFFYQDSGLLQLGLMVYVQMNNLVSRS
jgi:hypothetical protein